MQIKLLYGINGNPKLAGQPVQTWYWYDQYLNNPYWVANMYNDVQKRDRIMGNITLDAIIWKNIKYQTRFSVDYVLQNNLNEEYAGMNRVGFDYVGGKYYSSDSRTSDIYNDHLDYWDDYTYYFEEQMHWVYHKYQY